MDQLIRPRATVDLAALASNYQLLTDRAGGRRPAGIVKADAYGLGAAAVADRLVAEGCQQFFVARVDEGLALRDALPPRARPEILVLDGVQGGAERELIEADLTPVLNDLGQVERWRGEAARLERTLPAALHFDTGMTRLGIPRVEADRLSAEPSRLNGLGVSVVMSHLASADVAGSDQPARQLERFRRLRARFPHGSASLANSAGVFLGSEYHFDLVRPGIALYGGLPHPACGTNPMATVATVEVPVLQVQHVEADTAVGYGATHRTDRPTTLATLAVGYADGILRAASTDRRPQRSVAIDGRLVPVVGRVSMDLVVVDVGDLPSGSIGPGHPVEIVGPNCPVDDVAAATGTIANEILTGLSPRYERTYTAIDERRVAQELPGRR